VTDPTITAAAIVTVIAALFGNAILLINAWSSAKDRREAALERRILLEKTNAAAKVTDETAKKADTIIQKAVAIHTLANGTNSELTKALAIANEKIEALGQLMASMVAAKDEADAVRVVSQRDIATALAQTPPGQPGGPERRRTPPHDAAPIKVDIVSVPKDILP